MFAITYEIGSRGAKKPTADSPTISACMTGPVVPPSGTMPEIEIRNIFSAAAAASFNTPIPFSCLAPRERQIVRLIQQAKSNKEIAFELCLTVGTVKEYLYRIFKKVGVKNRTELALRANSEPVEASIAVSAG